MIRHFWQKIILAASLLVLFTSTNAISQTDELETVHEDYLSLIMCIHIAAVYFHEDQGIDPIIAVGRGSYECRDQENRFIEGFLKEGPIAEALTKSTLSRDDAIYYVRETEVLEIQQEVLSDITAK